jgi:hypothetical protein
MAEEIEAEIDHARRLAALSLASFAERPQIALEGLTYTAEQILGDWFPGQPEALKPLLPIRPGCSVFGSATIVDDWLRR